MKLGLMSKLRKLRSPGAFRNKVVPYLWFYLGGAALTAAVCRIRPVKKGKIVFYNMRGNSFGDHQKYITLELLRRKSPVEIVWLASDPEAFAKAAPDGIRVVRYDSFAALRELSTAQMWCVNQSQSRFILRGLRKRAGQLYFQTYHGSLGIKRIGADRAGDGTVRLWEKLLRLDAAMIDYLIADSEWESKCVYSTRFFGCGEHKVFGHPRNDVFFRDSSALAASVRERLGLDRGVRILFYAPTHRTDRRTDVIIRELESLRGACAARFGGEWRVVVRLHPIMLSYVGKLDFGASVVDATRYPDMQELLIASDILVSDYSSCMFDFMLTRRPVFVHAPDLEDYQRVQGFYYPMSETPFPVARTEAELAENIRTFDEDTYKAGVEAFLKGKGCVEDGRATERVCDLIESRL